MNPWWAVIAAGAGIAVGMLVAAGLTINDRAGTVTCSECAGVGAVVEAVPSTGRPRAVFCSACDIGRIFADQAATPVDFAAAVRRGHDGDINLDGGAR